MDADEVSSKSSSGRLLTPRDLAEAIGASESSVRRWVDAGAVKLSRTSGGHRRIPLAEAVRFIRTSGAAVLRPDLLGLGEIGSARAAGERARDTGSGDDNDAERLYHALRNGDRVAARGIMLAWYLAGRSTAALFDGPLRDAMARVGELWSHGEEGILVEHRATAIATECVAHLRTLLPAVSVDAPAAVGGAPSGEVYAIPSLCAAVVLAEAGFRDVNYGPNTPPRLLAVAAEQHDARVAWVSISTGGHDPRGLERELRGLAERIRPRGATLVLGGRHAHAYLPRAATGAAVGNVVEMQSMAELAAFAGGVLAATPGAAQANRRPSPSAPRARAKRA